MVLARIHRRHRQGEQGYILLLMLFFAAMLMISMTAAAPYLTTQVKRDRENEMIHRGEQYARAIKRYYKKFGRYPARIEDLEKTNNIRFLRKRYKDPLTPDGNWRLVRYGEVQMGGAQALAGAIPAANLGTGMQPSNTGSFGGSSFGSSNSANPQQTPGGTAGGTGVTGSTPGMSGDVSSSGSTAQSSGSLFGQQLGTGGAIIGVASVSKKIGLHEFNKKSAYKDWFFVYDPQQDKGQLIRGAYNPNAFMGQFNNNGQVGQPIGGQPNTGLGNPSGGFGSSGSGFGNSNPGFGNSNPGFGSSGFGGSNSGGAQVPPPPPNTPK